MIANQLGKVVVEALWGNLQFDSFGDAVQELFKLAYETGHALDHGEDSCASELRFVRIRRGWTSVEGLTNTSMWIWPAEQWHRRHPRRTYSEWLPTFDHLTPEMFKGTHNYDS